MDMSSSSVDLTIALLHSSTRDTWHRVPSQLGNINALECTVQESHGMIGYFGPLCGAHVARLEALGIGLHWTLLDLPRGLEVEHPLTGGTNPG
jgi:hypothetical protein